MLKLIEKIVFLIFIVLILQSCSSNYKLEKFRDKYMFSVKLEESNFTESISYNEVMGVMIIPVKIDGSTYNFLFDTGSITMVSSNLKNKLEAINKSLPFTIEDASGKEESADFGILPELKIGSINFLNVGANVADLSVFENNCLYIDGIIGANLMRSCFWKIDYVNKKILFSDQKDHIKIQDPEMLSVLFESFSGSPEVWYKWSQYAIKATWDTGYNGAYQINDSLYSNSKKFEQVKAVSSKGIPINTLYGNSNNLEQKHTIKMDSVIIIKEIDDNLRFKADYFLLDQEVEVVPYPASALIGNKFLSSAEEVLFDWKNNLVEFKKKPSVETTATFGFTAFKVDDKVKVLSITDGSEAQKQGLEIGDIITTIYDKNVSNLSQEQWCEAFHSLQIEEQDSIWFTVKKANEIKEIRLKKYSLFSE